MKALSKVVLGIVLAVVLIALHAGFASANLLTNGDFETGDFTGWTQSGEYQLYTYVYYGAFSGVSPESGICQAVFAGDGSDFVMSQTVSTVAGQNYEVQFWMASLGGTPNDFSATWDGTTLLSLANMSAQPYTLYSYLVTGTGSDTLTFASRNDPSYQLLDNVSVDSAPLPPGLLLFATGIFGLAAMRKRFKK